MNFHPATKSGRPKTSATDLGGVEGDRTPDLMNAIHALSQLSYDPKFLPRKAISESTEIAAVRQGQRKSVVSGK